MNLRGIRYGLFPSHYHPEATAPTTSNTEKGRQIRELYSLSAFLFLLPLFHSTGFQSHPALLHLLLPSLKVLLQKPDGKGSLPHPPMGLRIGKPLRLIHLPG